MTEVRPVLLETPQKRLAFIDPKSGTLTDYGHRVMTALFERTGGFDDDIWSSLGIGFTAISQQGRTDNRIADLESARLGLEGAISGLRGDPRLATADRAESKADDALAVALARAPADLVRRVEELEQGVAQVVTGINELRAMLQQQSVVTAEARQEAAVQRAFDASNFAATLRIIAADIDDDALFAARARDAFSGTSPIVYTEASGTFALNASLTSLGGLTVVADRFAYSTGADTWALGTITTFGRSILDDPDASAARTTLGLVIGTDVQAYDAALASLAGLTLAANKLVYSTAADTLATADFTPGAWTSYTPVVTATTPAGAGFAYTLTGVRYSKIGRTVSVLGQILITNLGAGPPASGNIVMDLPFTSADVATSYGYESGVSGLGVTGRIDASATTIAFRLSSGAATAVLNHRIWFGFTYEATT